MASCASPLFLPHFWRHLWSTEQTHGNKESFCLMEIRRTYFLFLLENIAKEKRNQLVYFHHQNVNSLCSRHHYGNNSCWFRVSIELSKVLLVNVVIWLSNHCIPSAISVQSVWYARQNRNVSLILRTFESTFANKWLIKFLSWQNGGHLHLLEFWWTRVNFKLTTHSARIL